MKKLFLMLTLLCAQPVLGAAIYFAQSSAGANNGTSCANARAISTNVAGDDVAGNVLHLCGTFTGAANQAAFLTMQGSGTSGNPITVVFESGALMQAPYFGTHGAIDTNSKTDIVIDGGTNGIIQNTANGDALANQQITTLILSTGCHRCEYKNLTYANAYVATPQNATVNTQNAATGGCAANCVTWVSGTQFNTNWVTGTASIKINGTSFTLSSVQSATVATVSAAPGTQTSVPFTWALGGNMTQINAIVMNGQHTHFHNNTVHDCGWCVYASYANNDTAFEIDHNEIYNWDHAILFATGGANNCTNDATLGCLNFHDNRVHDNANFEVGANQASGGSGPTCTYHLDGIHFFGQGAGGGQMDGIYVYNNYFYGSLSGPCSSGFLFMEADSGSSGANAKNYAMWNNDFDASNATTVNNVGNPNGWVGLFSGSTCTFVANTLLFKDVYESNSQTNGYNLSHCTLTFEDNLSNGVNMGNNLGNLTTPTVDYNFYTGPPCHLSNNCFIFNGSFESSFATWKSASGFDTHTGTSTVAAALLNSNGSPQSGSPIIGAAVNLSSLATGKLTTLQNDTTLGGTRTPNLRPSSGAWDVGAFEFAAATPPVLPGPAPKMLVTYPVPDSIEVSVANCHEPCRVRVTCISGCKITARLIASLD